jgi:exopolysaccharide biosynthesis WecB/TagA/CpsF family protein
LHLTSAELTGERSRLTVLGVAIDKLCRERALEEVAGWTTGSRLITYVNAHTLNIAVRDQALRQALDRSDLVLNDGIGLSFAARMRGERFPENLNGSDFTLCLLSLAAQRGWGVFLFGARPGVADAAARHLSSQIDGLNVIGTCHGYTGEPEATIAERVRRSQADLLLVALGNPLQEVWLDRNLQATGAHIGVGVGAFLDFSTGVVKRAPAWMNRLGIEWCFRLAQEPRRLWRRYIIGNPLFLVRAWRSRNSSTDGP